MKNEIEKTRGFNEMLDALTFVHSQLRPEGWRGEQTRLYDGCLVDEEKTVVELIESALAKAGGGK